MMRGHEKSDSVIVAAKLANKAEQSAAEPVEPRAGTKGNASQQSTCRTQSRVSVSQALEHIRRIARERKKERFTALFHHLNIDLLEEAFFELKEDAAPGVDRLTWTDYEADLKRRPKPPPTAPDAAANALCSRRDAALGSFSMVRSATASAAWRALVVAVATASDAAAGSARPTSSIGLPAMLPRREPRPDARASLLPRAVR
jgi:hypothetical protein